jgi:hypothetical protein
LVGASIRAASTVNVSDALDYLPWATEHGVRYCGQCWKNDALSYVAEREQGPNMLAHDDNTSRRDL